MGTIFDKVVNNAIANVPSQPRGRATNQSGVDKINSLTPKNSSEAFSGVEKFISGDTSPRKVRGTPDLCIDEVVIPGGSQPSPSSPAANVSIGPNSWGQGNNQATDPLNQIIPSFTDITSFVTVAQFNTNRTRLMISNTGANKIFIIFGKAAQYGADVSNKFHMIIPAGDVYIDDSWQGRVDLVSDLGSSVAVVEFSRVQNVSQ